MDTFESDFKYITDVIDGMESFYFGDKNPNKYNRTLVMSILDTNKVNIKSVEGTEGFKDDFKAFVIKVWESIKAFLAGIRNWLTGLIKGRKKEDKFWDDFDKAFGEELNKALNDEMESIKKSFNSDKWKDAFEERDRDFKERVNSIFEGFGKSANTQFGNDPDFGKDSSFKQKVEKELNQMTHDSTPPSNLRKWMDSRKKQYKHASVLYDLAESEWKVLDRTMDDIKSTMNSVSDNDSKEEQAKKRDKINKLKRYFNEKGRNIQTVTAFAKRIDSQIEKESKQILSEAKS